MSLKGGRVIVVRGLRFRWKFKAHKDSLTRYGDSPQFAHVAIQEDVEQPGRALLVHLKSSRFIDYATHDGDTGHIRHLARFGPGDVRKLIEHALDTGWEPSSKDQTVLPAGIELTDHITVSPS